MNIKIYKVLLVAGASIVLLSGCVGQNTLSGSNVLATGASGAASGAVVGAIFGGSIVRGAVAGAAANVVGQAVGNAVTGASNNR